jgi:acyl-coenzyme A thioesterase PaaI-like protein
MTAKAADKLKSDGWKIVETSGFLHLIGPLWQRVVDGTHEYALATEDKHHNRRGLVQGGVIMTFADRTCGMTARFVSGKPTLATVQLDTHFVEAGKIGEVLVSKPHVVRSTRRLIFITTEVTVDKRLYRDGERCVQDIEERGLRPPPFPRHCLRQTRSVCARERSDEAIHTCFGDGWIASLRSQ